MRATWAAAAVATAVLTTVGLAGCAGRDASAVGDPAATPSEEPSAEVESCPYLTAEQVSAALGAPTMETAGTVNACFFDPESGGGPSVVLSRIDIQIDPADYATQSRALCQGDVSDVDAGDIAFACVMGPGPQGQLYAGRVLVAVTVDGAADDAAGIAAAAALLPEVTIPPPA